MNKTVKITLIITTCVIILIILPVVLIFLQIARLNNLGTQFKDLVTRFENPPATILISEKDSVIKTVTIPTSKPE